MLVFAGDGHVFSRFGFQVNALLPVYGHVLDELEGIHEAFVVFGDICRHLERAIHGDIQGKLAYQGGAGMRSIGRVHLAAIRFEDARSVVHRTSNQAGERKDGGMVHVVSSERFVFRSASRFVSDKVRVRAA